MSDDAATEAAEAREAAEANAESISEAIETGKEVYERTREAFSPTDKLGGRKFILVVLLTVALVVLDLAGLNISEQVLETVTWLYAAFVGGNAASHIANGKKG